MAALTIPDIREEVVSRGFEYGLHLFEVDLLGGGHRREIDEPVLEGEGLFIGEVRVTAGTACLFIGRKTWRGEDSITYVRSIFAGTTFDLTAHFLAPPPGIS